MMLRLLLALPVLLFIFGVNHAHAESFDDVNVEIIEYNGNHATVQLTWNDDDAAVNYEVGCVSCMPNTSEFLPGDSVMMNDVTPFPNTSNVMFYLIAYDSQDEIIRAEQIIVNLEQ